jgi:predicted anti-sigma-YlaC factor YlaD
VTCREANAFLTDYVGGELAPEPLALFEHHISRCANCHAFLEQYRNTIRAEAASYASSEADAATVMPKDLVHGIMAAIKKSP